MDITQTKPYGLIPEAIPDSHPTAHQVFGSPAVADLPDNCILPDIVGPTDQGMTSFCYAYCVRQLCSDQDGIVYDENWQVAAAGRVNGSSTVNGCSALVAMDSGVIWGPLAATDAPAGMTWENKGPAFIADYKNWPAGLALKAAKHEKVSVLNIDGPYDDFDNVRAQIYAKQRHIAFATKWYSVFNAAGPDGFVPATILPNIRLANAIFSWHMYEAMDYVTVNGTPYIRCKPHEGAAYGNAGLVLLDRATVNFLIEDPLACALMYGDVPVSLAQKLAAEAVVVEKEFERLATLL